MLKVVVDTNIVVSAALSPDGNCAKILDIIAENEEILLYCNGEILFEYNEVLSRKRLKIADRIQKGIIESIIKHGIKLEPTPSEVQLLDESDRIFYDTALAAGAILITGNKKHYPAERFFILPAEFLKLLESEFAIDPLPFN